MMLSNQDEKQIKTDVRILKKKYKVLEQYYLKLIYEFCEFDIDRADHILTVLKDQHNPHTFIKCLLDNPHQSETAINNLEKQYYEKYHTMEQEMMEQTNLSADEYEQKQNETQLVHGHFFLEYDFFEDIPSDVCLNIMSYLDPRSFSQMACVNSHFYRYSRSESSFEYFKILCIELFNTNEPQMPVHCIFSQVRDYVLGNPLEFGPNYRNAVNNNLRYFVWKMEGTTFKVDNKYYKNFGNYRALFLQCPRIHLNGVYICRQKYIKLGEKNYMTHTTPIHIVYYYRYFRFFQDGSLLYYVSSKKQKNSKLIELLSWENRQNFDPNNPEGLMIGQYMQFKDKVYIKAVKYNSIFSYEASILASENRICDRLKVLRYTLEVVDEKEMIQVLYEAKPNKQELLFEYSVARKINQENLSRRAICDI